MSRPECPYDNAVAKSFLEMPRRELTKDGAYEGRGEAKQEIFKYIETYHDTVRQHSRLGYVSPAEYERGKRGRAPKRPSGLGSPLHPPDPIWSRILTAVSSCNYLLDTNTLLMRIYPRPRQVPATRARQERTCLRARRRPSNGQRSPRIPSRGLARAALAPPEPP